jgi:hypothetical protein
MKKNAILFFTLVGLLTFTYLFQEKGLWSKKLKTSTTLLEIPELDSIIFKDGSISLRPSPVIDNLKFPADIQAVDRFLKMLQSIVVKKEIQYDEKIYKNYFAPDALRLKVRRSNLQEIEFFLGEMVPSSEDFYWLEKKDNESKLFIASFEESLRSGETQYYNPGDKYKHLSQMLDLTSDTFFLSNVFSEVEISHTSTIKFVPKDLSSFEIPLDKESLLKIIPDYSFSWNLERIELLKKSLMNLKSTKIIQKHEKSEQVMEFIFNLNNGQKIPAKLLKSIGSDPVYYIQKDESSLWHVLNLAVGDLFLFPKEDFWLKKISFDSKNNQINTLTLKQFKNLRSFDVSKELSYAVKSLLDLLMARAPWIQADRISRLTNKDPVLGLENMEINFMGLNLFLTQKNDEIMIINKSKGYVLHYYLTDERKNHKIKFKIEEYN